MKFNTKMPAGLETHYLEAIQKYQTLLEAGQLAEAWRHLEIAHILGQAYPIAHTKAHWKMLQFGFKTKNRQEIIGQLPRLLVGGIKSFVGKIPVGNTGGANVPPLQPMAIPEELQTILKRYS